MDSASSLNFDGALSPAVVALIVAALVGAAAWTVFRSAAPLWSRIAILTLRTTAALALAVALLGPTKLTRDDIVLRPRALLLMDASQSMRFQDKPGAPTRRQSALDRLTVEGPSMARLAETHDLTLLDFGSSLREATSWEPLADDRVTASGEAIPEAVRRLKGRPGGSLVIISDGRTTSGPDPVRAAAGARERGLTVHTVGVGTTGPSSLRDRKVALIHCPGVAQIQAAIPIQAYIVAQGEPKGTIQVRLKIDGETVETKELVADEGRYSTRVSFMHTPATLGEKRVTVEVEASDGEFDSKNNVMSTFVRVVHKELHVLCLESKLSWESTFLRRVLAKIPDSQISTFGLSESVEPDPSLLDRVNVVIIGDTTSGHLGAEFLAALDKLVREREGGILFLAGGMNLGAESKWSGTPMESILPFWLVGSKPPAEELTWVEPTTGGASHFVMSIDRDPTRNLAAWRALPKLEAFARVGEPKPGATIIGQSHFGPPLVMEHMYGKGRVLAFLGEMSWKWALENDAGAEKYRRFWHQVVLWLARKEKSARRLAVDLPRYLFVAGDPVDVAVSVENPPGTPVEDATVTVEVEGPAGPVPAPNPAWFGAAYRATLAPSAPGDYRVTVEAKRGGDEFGQATARFTVIAPSAELDQPAPDHPSLMATAAAGGGLYRPLGEIHDVFEKLNTEAKPVRIPRVTRKSLWDRPWLVFVFAGALGLEWILRRRIGMA